MPVMVERMPIFDVWHAGRYLGQVVKQSEVQESWHAFASVSGLRKMKPIGGLVESAQEAATQLCLFHGLVDDDALFDDEC
jgi:hypothetical protein